VIEAERERAKREREREREAERRERERAERESGERERQTDAERERERERQTQRERERERRQQCHSFETERVLPLQDENGPSLPAAVSKQNYRPANSVLYLWVCRHHLRQRTPRRAGAPP
jgi:hypothetical protein